MKTIADVIVYIDGGSRGNPGPAAYGVTIEGTGKKKEYQGYLGEMTNNEAEYCALLFALRKVRSLVGNERLGELIVKVRSDSELLVNQVEGRFKIEEPRLQKLFIEFWNLKVDFPHLRFQLVGRSDNLHADALVNAALDRESSRLPGL